MDSGISITASKLVDITAKFASKMEVEDEDIIKQVGVSMSKIAKVVIERVSFWLVQENNNLLYCKLCNKGPFTKKGLYLHLSRVHRDEIRAIIEDELKIQIKKLTY
ncbi:MAG: hypothetical protein QXV69_04715 [Sulfolobaceae archaeon]